MARKPRSDSKLDSLPEEQREALRSWLTEDNLSYEQAQAKLKQEFAVSTSISSLQSFWRRRCFRVRASEAKDFTKKLEKELKNSSEDFDEATLALIRQKLFERAMAEKGDLNEISTLAKIIGDSQKLALKAQHIELQSRRLKLLEKKAEQADAAEKIAANGEMTPEQKDREYKAIFGIG